MTKPLFIWAGGKTKVIKHYKPYFPTQVNSYVEPFFGGGGMFCYIVETYNPQHLWINDINSDIISIYKSIKSDYDRFLVRLNELEAQYIPLSKEDRKKLYYTIREEHAWDYQKWDKTIEASTLYFLMKTGFNGIYQLNKNTNGRYGTPSGLLNQKTQVYDRNVLNWWNNALQRTTVTSGDWSACIMDKPDTFYFYDPPYRDSFADYGNSFGDESLSKLIATGESLNNVFIANRADDEYFDDKVKTLNVHYFDITYTAGRRKKGVDGNYTAKKAREILLYKTDRWI
jgi:DNA adenine methylase